LVTSATLAHVNIGDDLPNGPHLEVNEAIELGAGDTKLGPDRAQTIFSASEGAFAHLHRQLRDLCANALCHSPAMTRYCVEILRHLILPRFR
jgi:hypothetical protein